MPKRKRYGSRRYGRKKRKSSSGWSYASQGDKSNTSLRGFKANRTLSRWGSSFNVPDALRLKIKSNITVTFTSTSGAAQVTAIQVNSINRPFYNIGSSTHHSPTAGNMLTLYQGYCVLGASVKMKWFPPVAASNTIGGSGAMCVLLNTASSGANPSGGQDFEEVDRTTGQKLLPIIGGWSGQPLIQSIYVDCAKALGLSRPAYVAGARGAQTTTGAWADPVITAGSGVTSCDVWLYYQSADGSTTSTYNAELILTQYVEFYQRFRS